MFFAVAGLNGYILLRNNLGIDVKRGLPITLIAQQDIAIGADSASKGIVFNGCIQRAIAAVNEADRGCKCTPLTRITAVGEGAVLHGDSLYAICFVIEVYGNLATLECAVINDNRAVRIRVEGSCLGEKVAACYGDVIDTGSTADVYTLQINGGFSIAIGEIDIHYMVCMPLAPNAEVIKVGGCDGDILVEISTTTLDLRTGITAKHIGINFEVTFATGNISAVANNGNIIRNMAVGQRTDIGIRAAGDGDITIISHISGLQSIGQSGGLTRIIARLPINIITSFPGDFISHGNDRQHDGQHEEGQRQAKELFHKTLPLSFWGFPSLFPAGESCPRVNDSCLPANMKSPIWGMPVMLF